MKLDRNTNPDGCGKYALLKLRKVSEVSNHDVLEAIQLLKDCGLLHFGDEGPGEQFFVMKYKDKFTAPALRVYANAVREAAIDLAEKSSNGFDLPEVHSLMEYAAEILAEAQQAAYFDRIPD